MVLLKNGAVSEDTYIDASSAELIPDSGAIIISLAQWQEQKSSLAQRADPLGIV